MLAVTRKAQIKDIIQEKKSVLVSELALIFSVTEGTIRRDLKSLEEEGFLTRTYGGAFIQDGVANEVDLDIRETVYEDSKMAIAQKALGLIHNGDTIFLDSSTTSYFIAKAAKDMNLTILTNSLLIIDFLSKYENIRLICIGGQLSHKSKSFIGRSTHKVLNYYFVDKSFMSCRSLSLEHGITDSNEETAIIRQCLLDRSNKIYIVADYSKFDRTSFVNICDFSAINGIITDYNMSDEWIAFLKDHNVELHLCNSGKR